MLLGQVIAWRYTGELILNERYVCERYVLVLHKIMLIVMLTLTAAQFEEQEWKLVEQEDNLLC